MVQEANGRLVAARSLMLVVLSGLPGTGKSTLGRQVARRLNATMIETDQVRRELLHQRDYGDEERQRVYAACYERVEQALAAGRDVIFDATNLTEAQRAASYRLAERYGARLTIVQTVLDEDEVRRRLTRRGAGLDPEDRSEALWPVYADLARQVEPISRRHIVVDMASAPDTAIERVVRAAREAPPSECHQAIG